MNELVFEIPIWFYPLLVLISLIPFLWVYGYEMNPITRLLDWLEERRLVQAYNEGLTWEEYKKKYGI